TRDSYYRLRDLYKHRGASGLKPMSRRRPLAKNRVKPHVEQAVLALTREHPGWGQARVAKRLHIEISATGVRGVWKRHNLTTRRLRGFVHAKGTKRTMKRRRRVARTDGWTYELRYVKCRKPTCPCAKGGPPYWYRFRRRGGVVQSKCLGPAWRLGD